MSEQARFQEWWDECGFNSVILRAAAWQAWMARAKADQPQPSEDPDEWVIQDCVPVRRGIDRINWVENSVDTSCEPFDLSIGKMHGYVNMHGATLHVYCRRRDLPKVEQVEQALSNGELKAVCDDVMRWQNEQWPKYYKPSHECRTADGKPVAFFKMRGVDDGETFHTDGTSFRWSEWVSGLAPIEITEAEALALLKPASNINWQYHEKQKPQPQKTMLRLWIDPDCNIHAGLKGDRDLELHYDHETRQFYTEEQS